LTQVIKANRTSDVFNTLHRKRILRKLSNLIHVNYITVLLTHQTYATYGDEQTYAVRGRIQKFPG